MPTQFTMPHDSYDYRLDCGKSIETDNGAMIYVSTSFPCLVTYECVDGFELVVGIFCIYMWYVWFMGWRSSLMSM